MKEEERKRWIKAGAIAILVLFFFTLYLFLRRGYVNLYILNKALASSAVIVAGITLIIGPLSKYLTFFAKLMTIRRHLGLWAFGLAIIHIIASLIQQDRFPLLSWYIREWLPILAGVVAISTWAYMTYISRNKKIKEMGVDIWKRRLRLASWIAFLAIFLHLTIMKYPGWVRWFNEPTPYPPASLFVFAFMLIVIVYRISQHLVFKRGDK